jgi:DNA-binding transcriptional MerR regulator
MPPEICSHRLRKFLQEISHEGGEAASPPHRPPKPRFLRNFCEKDEKNTLVGVNSKPDNSNMTIAEEAEQYGLSTDTLRYYERIGLLAPVPRRKNGVRDYSEIDCKAVEFVKCMRSAGIPVESLIEYVKLLQQGAQTREIRKEILREQRQLLANRIAKLQETFENLDFKINNYDTVIVETEKKLAREGR